MNESSSLFNVVICTLSALREYTLQEPIWQMFEGGGGGGGLGEIGQARTRRLSGAD